MSSRDDELWARVNEALDGRRDPLSDPEVRELLAERPERAAEVTALTQAIEAIGRTGKQGRSPAVQRHTLSTGRGVAAAAAAGVLALAAVSWWVASRPGALPPVRPGPRAIDVVRPFAPGASPVVSWSVKVERRDARMTTSDSLGSDGVRATDTSTAESNADSARIVVHSFTRHP